MSETSDVSVLFLTSSGAISGPGENTLVAGILKLAQKVLLELLTSQGSMPYNSDIGSSFLTTLSKRNIYSEYDVFMTFALASASVKQHLQLQETEDMPTSEKLRDIKLKKIVAVPETLLLTVTVTNQENKTIDITIGVEVTAR